MKLIKFKIQNFKSLINVEIDISNNSPVIICGANNIGKTNVLSAMNLFFNHTDDEETFHDPSTDIPHHIVYGSAGSGNFTRLSGIFESESGRIIATVKFTRNGETEYDVRIKGKQANDPELEFTKIVSKFGYFFIRSNNINMPKIVSHLFSSKALNELDKKRRKQSLPLETLRSFQKQAQNALNDIEKQLNIEMESIIGNDLNNKPPKLKISFAEFNKLRDVVSNMTNITLDDGNDLDISSKGSGAQRLVLISLMKYIGKNTSKKVIWALDEPEVFLQPGLQKKLFKHLKRHSLESNDYTIITTHSHHFIDIADLRHTYLFEMKQDKKEYTRTKSRIFTKKDTSARQFNSSVDKAQHIMKHLGIDSGDNWSIMPHNIIVEGETDKEYLEILLEMGLNEKTCVKSAGSASKITSHLGYYDDLSEDLDFKPIFQVVVDFDSAGKAEIDKIKSKKFKNITVNCFFYPRSDGHKPENSDIKKMQWYVEDFIPEDLYFDGLNKLLKLKKYNQIPRSQRLKRNSVAYIKKSILDVSRDFYTSRNQDKEQIDIYRLKMLLCKNIKECVSNNDYTLNETQLNFLNMLVNNQEAEK
ncbi:ATP-dependent endonuclease [Vibrio parahaemolyticus]|nr:ATP-binding protein [Vibrio diabolicus]MCS0407658.1 ATP-binding protein [Vibrio diabolicus]